MDTLQLSSELSQYGIQAGRTHVRWFNSDPKPDLIEYLDLVHPDEGGIADSSLPDGVAENQDRPLLFFVNASRLAEVTETRETQLSKMRRALACRGDRAYLAVVRPGSLAVLPVSLTDKKQNWKIYQAGTAEASTFFSRLALGRCEEMPTGPDADYLFREMFQLVDRTATRLEELQVDRADVLSLVGRALFFRFLTDRLIAKPADLKVIAPKASALAECFDNAENATATSDWLDRTFNGDFLPLSSDGGSSFFEVIGLKTDQRVYHHLGGIVRGAEPVGDDAFQLRLPIHWGDLNFAHIPVGLLSQVYEKLSWKWDIANARSTSVHYTPRNIAATLVGEAFDHLAGASQARVLDPACGAGVFLVIAFRRLYRELWDVMLPKRPDTAAIRKILENQLVGFDISDSALKLTALSLYLTAIELDPDPAPPEKLKFKALRHGDHALLFDWRRPEDGKEGPVIGSLGEHVDARFNHAFDLILCNPPWTNIPKDYKPVADKLNVVSRAIVTGLDAALGKRYENPDSVPDLPFLWRSMQWCRPGGRIAMALPARTLFKQGKPAIVAREAIFKLLEVTGIINASNLRKTEVWPDMDQPFMLLFARNERPPETHRFHFISPHTDARQNSLGEMRIDFQSSQCVEVCQIIEEPWLLKALAIGTSLDVDVVRKIRLAGGKPMEIYWTEELNLNSRNGYQIKLDQKQRDARPLQVLKDLNTTARFRFVVDALQLELFSRETVCWPRIDLKAIDPLRAYRGPLALIKENPGPDRTKGWALFCSADLAYNQSYYGYSGAGHKDGEFLVKYLQIFVHSALWSYYALLTSAKLGVERPNVYKADLDNFPFMPAESFSVEQRETILNLSERLFQEDEGVFKEIDGFIGQVYGLSQLDVEVIEDTLTVREPNDELGVRASRLPTPAEVSLFTRRIARILNPFFKALGHQSEVILWEISRQWNSPFLVLIISIKGSPPEEPTSIFRETVLPLANETGATRIIMEGSGSLFVGLLAQYRYWTPSRARMLCAEIIREHLTVFEN